MFANEVDENGIPNRMLPLEERYSARWFELQDVFVGLDIQEDNSLEVEEFYDLSSWDNYKNYLSSELSSRTKRPSESLMKFKEFGSISLDRTD